MVLLKNPERAQKSSGQCGGDIADRQREGSVLAAKGMHGFFQFGGFPQYLPRVHQRPVPRSCQFQPIAQPFKELYAQLFFQIFDLSRDGGLRNMQSC